MEDIEKEIAGEEVLENTKEVEKEDDTIKFSKPRSNNDNKRNIIIIILIGIAIVLIGVIIYLTLVKNSSDKKDDKEVTNNTSEVVKEETGKKVSYVSCDDNTALLNVRNSSTGDIIDGLSCYKEIEILEEIEGTDTCNKWYRINYNKHGSSFKIY